MFSSIAAIVAAIANLIGGGLKQQYAVYNNDVGIDTTSVNYQYARQLALTNAASAEKKMQEMIVAALVIGVVLFLVVLLIELK